MPRLFVAIDFPPDLKVSFANLCLGVPAARWVQPGNFHLTLRFIGQVDYAVAAEINSALMSVNAPGFKLTLAGVGHFGWHTLLGRRRAQPRTDVPAARDRSRTAADRLTRRPSTLVPHVKLARLRRRGGLPAFLAESANFRAEPFAVRQFSLIESHLGAHGPIYQHKTVYALQQGRTPARCQENFIDD